MTADMDHVGIGLGDPRRDGPDAGLGDQLHAHKGARIGLLKVVNELRQVLNAVDVVVWGRRDERHAGNRVADGRDVGGHLVPRELSTFAGLGALRHLDLKLVGRGQIGRRHAEPGRGHLLHATVGRIPVLSRLEPRGVFSAFPGVAPSADPVHGDGQGLVGLRTQGPQRHGGGPEPLPNLLHRLDPLQRRPLRFLHFTELQEVPWRRRGAVVHEFRITHVRGLILLPDRLVEGLHHVGVEGVVLPGLAITVAAPLLQLRGVVVLIGLLVSGENLAGDPVESQAAERGGCAGKTAINHFIPQPHGFEDLRPVVTAEGGDAHLGHDFEEPLFHYPDKRPDGLFAREPALRIPGQRFHHLQREVRMNGARPVSRESGEVVHVARFAGICHQTGPHPAPFPDKALVHRTDGQQHRNGRQVSTHAPVAQDEDGLPGLDCGHR